MPTETVLLIEIDNVPTLTLERTVGDRPFVVLVPDLAKFTPSDWQRVEAYYREIGFPDYVASGQFEKYVKQVYHNLRKEGSNE